MNTDADRSFWMAFKSRQTFEFFYALILSLTVVVISILKPAYNWDIIGYVAATLKLIGFDVFELHKTVFLDVSSLVSKTRFEEMTSGDYRAAIYLDHKALEQQLPFYEIRYLYNFLIAFLGWIIGSYSKASIVVSAVSGGCLVLITYQHAKHFENSLIRIVILPVIIFFGLIQISRFSTPDCLAALAATTMFLCIVREKISATIAFIIMLPLFRTDYFLLSLLVAGFYFMEGRRKIAIFSAFGAFIVYLLINYIAGNYGHLVIFNFTLIQGPHAYVDEMQLSTDLFEYLKAYLKGIFNLANNTVVLSSLFAMAAFVVPRFGKTKYEKTIYFYLFMISFTFVLIHFALFPAGFERNYYILKWISFVCVFKGLDVHLKNMAKLQ